MSREPGERLAGTLDLFKDESQEMIRPEVLEDLTEAEREEIFYQEIAERGPEKDRALKVVYQALGAESRRGRDCPKIFETIVQRLSVLPNISSRQLWDQIAAEDALRIYLGTGGRLHEDGAKSLSFRSFQRYCTEARRDLSS